ncbi:YitT family protein [Rhodalgimonas zhirmunskyi]|uniref:YitT family protein n=1 Tax=Rhodalgimonas zhirmunskyi TaxID=2964767 RepID=A0AAJ1X468_9RHOB|nr:YitT family protein [Rhodoalgimonas zhirmunskyi]MDQ2092809.1 YitT family protein [Rhodoalgimonas zhirmunskyi]
MTLLRPSTATAHSPFEDLLGLISGAVLMALTVHLMRAGGLITGQIAGLSLVLSYVSAWSFGAVFFVLNLPFYWLAVRRMGWTFTLKTFFAVALLSGLTGQLPLGFQISWLHPGLAALLTGITGGTGLLILFRHGATLGGVGIVAVWLQDTRGIKAGHVQLAFDAVVFALAFTLFPWKMVAWSLLGAVILNIVILVNHRRDRYIAR